MFVGCNKWLLLVWCSGGGNHSYFCEFVKKLHDACECPICQELCCQPRMLPCSHTFCQKCLKGCSTSSTSSLWFPYHSKCPLCRQLYTQPAEGITALPTNRLLSRILNKLSEPGMCIGRFRFSVSELLCLKHKCNCTSPEFADLICAGVNQLLFDSISRLTSYLYLFIVISQQICSTLSSVIWSKFVSCICISTISVIAFNNTTESGY